MIKRFRAWDGNQYWYADDNWIFTNGYKAFDLRAAPFELKDVDMFINKQDVNGAMIYENDLIVNKMVSETVFHVIWSEAECGFRKVPIGMSFPETKIDEAFMEVIGTNHSEE